MTPGAAGPRALTIGVVGAGTISRGVVQLFVQAGHTVWCHDAAPGAARDALTAVRSMLDLLAAKGRLDAAARAACEARLRVATRLEDLASCDVVVEAIVEDLAAERTLFGALERLVAERTILATDTSSLTVAEIAMAGARPERVAGLPFFDPVPPMRVGEVIAAVRTATPVVDTLRELVEGAGHRAVVVADDDSPGSIVQRVLATVVNIAANIARRGIASIADPDAAVRPGSNHPHGPLARGARGDRIGAFRVATILRDLQDATGDPAIDRAPGRRAGSRPVCRPRASKLGAEPVLRRPSTRNDRSARRGAVPGRPAARPGRSFTAPP